jgi:hypothetical protein
MTTKEQNERLWRAIDNYQGWLLEEENKEYESGDLNSATVYSNCAMELFDLMKEENLYELIKQKE